MAALEVHHRLPLYLLRAHEDAEAGVPGGAARFEWEVEAARYGLDPEISREDLAQLVEGSTVAMSREEHRHACHAGDWQRFGRLGGLTTFERYGAGWFALLARRRWKRVRVEMLQEYRAGVAQEVGKWRRQ
jgi:hypothetical protein